MGYLERNAEIVSDIKDGTASGEIDLHRRGHIAKNEFGSTRMTSVGSFRSKTFGKQLHMGVKVYSPDDMAVLGTTLFVLDLAVVRKIEAEFPHLAPELPVFYSLLRNQNGKPAGFLMDDFSEGGRNMVRDVSPYAGKSDGILPEELLQLNPSLDDVMLANACFLVGDIAKRRIGDFNQLLTGMSTVQVRETFKPTEVRERLDEFIVFVPEGSI